MKYKNALEAVEFAKKMQKGEIATTEENVEELCKMAGVKLTRVDIGKYAQRTLNALSKVKLTARERREKDPDRNYFTPSELGKKVGKSGSTIRRELKNDPGVKKQTFAGPNRRKVTVMHISRAAAKRRYPALFPDLD